MRVEPSFGHLLQQRRKALDLTQSELAQRVACARVTIQKMESGRLRPSKQMAERLAYHLAVPPQERAAFIQWARDREAAASSPIPLPTTANPASGNQLLPISLMPLIGRETEVTAVRGLLRSDSVRLVVLVGAPGIGKTRLALQVATDLQEHFRDGVYFVPLAAISDAVSVPSAIAEVLGVQESAGKPLLDTLKHFLRDKHLLLALDNFEQLIPAAPVVSDVLASTHKVKILVTSREVLHLYGENDFEVPPLALPDLEHLPPLGRLAHIAALELFLRRAQATKASFVLSHDNASAVAELCVHLDGLPLAIELAAARVNLFTPQALLARLAKRFEWLTDGPRDLPIRHQTLRATIDWSYNLLDDKDKLLFRRFGVFVGGFALQAAETICDLDGSLDILGGLASLVDKSLLSQQGTIDGEPQFGMLETIREYAHEKLVASAEATTLRNRHLDFYLALAETAEPKLRGPEQAQWLARLGREENLRAAIEWAEVSGDVERWLRLVGALAWFSELRGHLTEGRQWVEKALAQAKSERYDTERQAAAVAKALNGAGRLACKQDDQEAARGFLNRSLALSRHLEDEQLMLQTLHNLGNVALSQGHPLEARAYHQESLLVSREVGSAWGMAWAHMGLGHVAQYLEDLVTARAHFEESLKLRRALGDRWGIARSLNELGEAAYGLGQYAQARPYFEESLRIHQEMGHRGFVTWALYNLGRVLCREGQHREAAKRFNQSLVLFREQNRKNGTIHALVGIAQLALIESDIERAARLFGAVETFLVDRERHFTLLDRSEVERCLHVLRTRLGEPALATAWTLGKAMTLDDAVGYALGENEDFLEQSAKEEIRAT